MTRQWVHLGNHSKGKKVKRDQTFKRQNNESESIISIDMGEGMKARIQTSELEKLKQ